MATHRYEAFAEVPQDHCLYLPLPPEIPVGPVRVTVMFESPASSQATDESIKRLLGNMPDLGEDSDFERPLDDGREVPDWVF
ncbi:hypothetical protein CKO42_20460 [Lamprobacter modestohalophilus]|uniref:Uncharacterized protein n=1 Tax=Lamprobacter modestohalophilus TaxID=1064514 RepID=A0A9X1B5P9_9GAMM|nr:hypothetical protein [Lamprobacter modestohalophilus]MBK1620760.1 hypothetical protein [Lamprobacter modestohalophilus]